MIGEESCRRWVKEVIQRSSADQTEAVLLTEDSSLTRFARNSIHQHVAERNATLILRVIKKKRVAVLTTNRLDRTSLNHLLQRAIAIAEVQPPNEEFVSLPAPRSIPEVETFHSDIERLTPSRKTTLVEGLIRMVKGKGLEVSGAFSNGRVEVSIANSLGVEAYQRYSDLFIHLIVQKDEGSGYASFVSRDPNQLDLSSLANEAVKKVRGGSPVGIKPGEYEVILEPYAVSELLSFLGYLGFHALAIQEGRSFFCNRLGQKMVDEAVTIYDDGLDPEGLMIPFDFEGVPKQKVVFLEKGVAKAVTYDSFTGHREGRPSTGHALVAPNTEGPIPINLLMKEGTSSLEEMVRSVRKGIYVTRFHYTNVIEPIEAVVTGMTRDGTFLIEEGEIKSPLKNLRFTESILRALSRVRAVSRQRRICSEGTVYSRRFITGVVAPAIKVDGFYFSGVSAL